MFRKTKARLHRTADGIVAHLFPLNKPETIDREKPKHSQRVDAFLSEEQDYASGVVNWAASGMMIVLQTKDGVFVPIGYRDAGAPTHPEKLGTPSGIADVEDEVFKPRLMAYREALEEILLYDTANEEWIRPAIATDWLYTEVVAKRETPTQLYQKWDAVQNRDSSVTEVPATFHSINTDKFIISHPTEEMTNEICGQMIIDTETLNVDLLDVIVVDASAYHSDDLAFYDGEVAGGDLLDRPVYLFTVESFISLFAGETTAEKYQSGRQKSVETREFDGVPVLRKSHKVLCDWITNEFEEL